MPAFNDKGELTGLIAASPRSVYEAVRNIVKKGILPMEDALKPVTVNPATSLKLPNKGKVKVGFDADFVILDEQLNIRHVFAKGRCMVKDQQVVAKGVFEK